ncbi:MAG: glycoside hydrolase family 3 C-terminal domain-containing protein [Actinomyces sp.]|jgi:beta-glucosidase|nr:glycoside hydrolase family 3 N-terminal domain-containing protein [Actinomyces sp.]MCI1788795.1 glycoside hydrolase family 3 C-terminal domain-containing protein [Actinomyces sp.]MCI1831206.1 glycoside hydrolase family 3 C-terminal domain-containing protein [Actinomyces sp.]
MTSPRTSSLSAPYRDPALPIPQRVADLLARMTPEEKVGQMMQLDAKADYASWIRDYHAGSLLHTSPERLAEAHRLNAGTRLAIPLLVGEDCIHGFSFFEGATIFPTQLGMAASWDPDLLERAARATAVEASAAGIHWTFSPVLCLARDLRWGRVDETFGEDPFLIGELASAMVRGYQGSGLGDPTAVLATAKHFAGYSETQGGRDASEADLSRRKLRSWFLPPFERVAREGCRTFMLGYQTTDGVPITLNEWLLTDVLRAEWGYRGMLVTDWDNVGRMVWEQHVQPDFEHAAAAAVSAGNDMIMTTPQFFEGALAALRDGLLTESQLDAPVSRILTLKFELGLFEDPRRPDPDRVRADIGTSDHAALNLEIARRSLVLLRNRGALPLGEGVPADRADSSLPARRPRLAVVGPLADDAQAQLGDWAGNSGQVDWMPDGQPREMITTVLDGLREVGGAKGWEVAYARGADILVLAPDPEGETFPDGQPRPPVVRPVPADPDEIARAVALARESDVCVAVVGDRVEVTGEGRSTATLDLLGGQIALLDALSEALSGTGIPLVVVLMSGKPLVLPRSALDADAVIWTANPGMKGGQALAELLFGDIEPSGRLPISFARHVGQQPAYYNQIRGQHGGRYADLTQTPAFAFGEGLSYTTVVYSDLQIGDALVHMDGQAGAEPAVRARVTVTNMGERPALETVEVYIRDLVTSASWADKELKAYRQVRLAPGEQHVVDLEVPLAACSIVDASGRRVVEPGEFELLVGHSSKEGDLLRAGFTVAS